MTSQAVDVDAVGTGAARRAHGSSFYAAMRIMPQGQREAMFEIYSFCRAVDDIADDPGPKAGRLEALQCWRSDIDAVYSGETRAHLRGLAIAVRDFQLNARDFLAIIDGMEMDVLEDIQAPDFAKFDLYCDRVASAVGRLSGRVFRLPHDDGEMLAAHLGRALQFTNILRDLEEDAAMNRLYLPGEYLTDAGIPITTPAAVLAHPKLGEVCDRIVALARERFVAADAIMRRHPRQLVRTPRVMSHAYKSILDALVARGWKAPRAKVRLGKGKLVVILVRNFIF